MPPASKRKVAEETRKAAKKIKGASSSAEELLQEVDRMLGMEELKEATVKVEQHDYSDLIKNKIFDDDEDSDDGLNQGENLFEAEGGDDSEEEKEEELEVSEIVDKHVQATFGKAIDQIEMVAKLALAAKGKQIDELKGTVTKAMHERDVAMEKYKKYKRMAEQTRSSSGNSLAMVKDLEEANRDVRTKAELRETLLNEERNKNKVLEAKLEEFQTKMKMLAHKLTIDNDRQGAIAMFDTTGKVKTAELNDKEKVKYKRPSGERVNKAIDEAAVGKQVAKNIPPTKVASQMTLKPVEVKMSAATTKVSVDALAEKIKLNREENLPKKYLSKAPKDLLPKVDLNKEDDIKKLLGSNKDEKVVVDNPPKKEAGQNLPSAPVQKEAEMKTKMKKLLGEVRLWKDTEGRIVSDGFLKLPTKKALPDYYDVIKKPMDICKIQQKIANDQYSSMLALQNDFVLMIKNAQKYNIDGCEIFNDSITLMKVFDEIKMNLDQKNDQPKAKESELEADLPKPEEFPSPKELKKIYPGISVASTKTAIETPAKNVTKKLPAGISFDSRKEEAKIPDVQKKVMSLPKGILLNPTKEESRVPIAETPVKKGPKKLPAGLSLNSSKEEMKIPQTPARKSSRSLGNLNVSVSASPMPATPRSSRTLGSGISLKKTSGEHIPLALGDKIPTETPNKASKASILNNSSISIGKASDDKITTETPIKAAPKSILNNSSISISKPSDETNVDSTEDDNDSTNSDAGEESGSNTDAYDSLLSRIRKQLKQVQH